MSKFAATTAKAKFAPALLALAGCAVMPTGPSHMALPGTGKNFDQFRIDDADCRHYALLNSGATPAQAQESSAARSALIGALVGAAAGAALGGHGHDAAAGAGAGLIVGSLAGISAADYSGRGAQQRYDDSYTQCMYAKGHRVAIPYSAYPQWTPPHPQPQPYYAVPPPGSAPPPPAQIVR